ncbi:MAG: hypothetical protein K2Q24_08890 [Chitinophagaceae bacterium]|nr:hypothetical protein [Chitinophagaceae bacterium]
MKNLCILFFFQLLFFLSCEEINKLSESDRLWMPYKGNETQVFKSNIGETDTIFFIRKDTLWGYPAPTLSTNKYEELVIFSKHSDPSMSNGHRYLEHYFMKIIKTMSRKAELVINLSAKDAKFYRLSAIRIDSLKKVIPINFATAYGFYDDVYLISGEDFIGTFQERSNYVTKIYWSKSKGLIRYDKKDSIYWELKE